MITYIACPNRRCTVGAWWLDEDLAKAKNLRCENCGTVAPIAAWKDCITYGPVAEAREQRELQRRGLERLAERSK